jgi:predicted nucleic acid-binding protein
MMKVVTNSTPLIELSKINRLDLLRDVYGTILIPEEVYVEVVIDGIGEPGAAEVKTAEWIYCQSVADKDQIDILQTQHSLHLGECATIVLAKEVKAEQVILDDNAARQVAVARGLPVIGTVGVLLVAKTQSVIPVVRPILDNLRAQGTWISQDLYYQVIKEAGE